MNFKRAKERTFFRLGDFSLELLPGGAADRYTLTVKNKEKAVTIECGRDDGMKSFMVLMRAEIMERLAPDEIEELIGEMCKAYYFPGL